MSTPEYYHHQIGVITGDDLSNGAVDIAYEWHNYTDAKGVLADLRRKQKELRALKRQINAAMTEIRSEFTSASTAVGKGAGTAVAGLFVNKRAIGKMNSARRDDLRREKERVLRPYSDVKGLIDKVIHQMDVMKHQVEISEEYQNRPAPKSRSKAKKSSMKEKARRYYAFLSDEVKGPFTAEELEGLIKAHVADEATRLCVEGEEDWHSLSHFFDVGRSS